MQNKIVEKIRNQEPYLYITCTNSKHGYGLRTVRSIVNRYNGIMDADYNETTFTVTLALKDRDEKRK